VHWKDSILHAPLTLEGYLTGVIVAPGHIPAGMWLSGLGFSETVFDDESDINAALEPIALRYNELSQEIDRSLARLKADRVCDYRPGFLNSDGIPVHADVREWAAGFWRAMQLAPKAWSPVVEDEKLSWLLSPLVGFIEIQNEAFEPPDDFEERLNNNAAEIPRAVLLLSRFAKLKATQASAPLPLRRRVKVGRNEPCSCGSGKKYKQCCLAN